ncbi:hypothetical protein OG689_39495 [Kitasatospora sp. NBC_00240]|uniref:hypothetical protein n=1 Tax=Kitasatospora sp. NBC_00240 TaxID=2903567 RepID=UPI002254AE3F|nr:hypothetical protein [Kitasatospora sp. NBC_00240]MCX5215274.1 hypothetical protein [Kitasatospora sp. NBC_00240]
MPLDDFVVWALGDRVVPHQVPAGEGDHRVLWTAPMYIVQEAAFAATDREHRAKRTSEERRRRPERYAASAEGQDWRAVMPMGRRFRLEAAAAGGPRATAGRPARLGHDKITDLRWAGGLPVYVSGRPYAVLRPAVDRAVWTDLAGLVVLTAGDAERRAIADRAPALTSVPWGTRRATTSTAATSGTSPPPRSPGPTSRAATTR